MAAAGEAESASSSPSHVASPPTSASDGRSNQASPPTSDIPESPSSSQSDSQLPSADSYQALYELIKDKPCRVIQLTKIHEEEGVTLRTKQHIIDRELERVHAAETLEEIHAALEEAGRNLQQLGVFNKVDILVNEEPEDDPEACTVLLELAEKNWYKAHAATYFQGGENTVEIGVGLHNGTGHAEHLTATAEYGTQLSNNFALTYEQPRPWGLPFIAEARAHQHLRNHVKQSSYSEKLRGIVLAIKSMSGVHSLQYELGWRSLLVDVTASGASRAVHDQAGDFLKAAARYTYFLDHRNHPMRPNQGWALRSTTEVSGLGPDQGLRYAKQQLDLQVLLPITQSITLNIAASTGLMLPWGGEAPLSRPTCIADRFFLGGPSTLRGFKFQGVGPTDERRHQHTRLAPSSAREGGAAAQGGSGAAARRDMLGGDLYSTVLAEITFPLPHKAFRALNIFGHLFANGGNCDLLAGVGQPLDQCFQTWANSWRWSAGVGLVLPTWFGRFEANYVHVLASQEHDRVKRGMQLGFATSVFA